MSVMISVKSFPLSLRKTEVASIECNTGSKKILRDGAIFDDGYKSGKKFARQVADVTAP